MLGGIEQLGTGASVGVVTTVGNRVRYRDEAPENRALLNDARIGNHIGRAMNVGDECAEIIEAAGFLQLVGVVQRFTERDHVDGFAGGDLLHHGIENQAVFAPVEVGSEEHFMHGIPAAVVEHQRAQYGLLSLNRMGRHLEGGDFFESYGF